MFHVKRRTRRLHLFDLDGTLIRGSAAAVEISRQLGLVDEIAALEEGFLRGLTPDEFAVRARALWVELTVEQVAAAFDGAPWLTGIREVWADIRERGDRCAVISLSPDFFVERLLAWGADAAHGSAWPAVPFTEEIHRPSILDAKAKVRIARRLCAEYGVAPADCVAYGDSMSDAELFAIVPETVAVNADHHLAGLSLHSYTGGDLREAYALVQNRAA
ncbi:MULTISPECIES: HAD-IB family phosphatase [unclassified Streptomyces]|uniref:HAD family hydrolase n=1 Tax=unclassified Streptomyces TaxID=2593676 RepID=UPI0006F71A92|nr:MULTISPECIES: HAD-IB family phosphatase [unclassified Streptomyces]KQX49441.1 hydrolase [Streptomyces sp. Root1304]KRA79060.1 hydrolase [Streptomyces sp. Root66D1]